MKKTNKISASSIILWCVLGLSLVHFTFLLLGLFNVLNQPMLEKENFNFVVSFVLVALCLAFYIAFMFIEKKKNLVVPAWFKIVLYVSFYVFTNLYYYFGLYSTIYGLIGFYAVLALILNIISLALFFNAQKTDSNLLRATPSYSAMTIFAYTVCFATVIEVIISALKVALIPTSLFSSLSYFIIDICVVLIVSILMSIFYSLSLSKKKKFINACLIKVYKEK